MNKKTLLITGASRGIGEQLAYRYASSHTNLILIARDLKKLEAVAQYCKKQGAHTLYEGIDVQDGPALKEFISELDANMPIDLVIANAGVSSTLQSNWQPEHEEEIHQVFAVNLQGTLNTVSPLIHKMIERKKGQIALMGSMAGLRGLPQSPSYCASKAALHIYGQSLRAWLSRYHVGVSVICPGYVKTQMSDRLTGFKPFLISSEKAAHIIHKGLLKNKNHIAFPWPLHYLTQLSRLLPSKLVDTVLNQFESYRESS
jgi:short-subunit dehydrogenase